MFIPRLLRKQHADLARGGYEGRARLLRRQAGISERELGHGGLYVREPRPRRHLSVPRRAGRGGGWVWVGVEDATKLHDELVARGVAIRMPLSNFSWALEFQVEDPDGNVLRFGSEPIAGVKICLGG